MLPQPPVAPCCPCFSSCRTLRRGQSHNVASVPVLTPSTVRAEAVCCATATAVCPLLRCYVPLQNPDKQGQGANVPSAGPDPEYSHEQREEFGDRAWIGVEDRSLLDVAGTELLLVGAKDRPIETGET